jgi:hypothetical protein
MVVVLIRVRFERAWLVWSVVMLGVTVAAAMLAF